MIPPPSARPPSSAHPTFDGSQRGASRTSVPGEARVSYGGVGRNIAEIVARLGGAASLVSAVGDDDRGAAILEACRSAGVAAGAVEVVRGARTATYSALMDGGGELVGAVADIGRGNSGINVAVFDRITPASVQAGLLAEGPGADLVLCDANLGREALQRALDYCAGANLQAWLEPVSVAKAVRGRLSRPWDSGGHNFSAHAS
ncbi:unnamed protein product [Prorocentrum cordatum]|uniref:Carbohydrate kinase PfkB domain-containing protein n=1 Tax=Prorocentrum cordatum TaxID=2364126 RepID=A0ABN9RGL6_9DINO|nr:unnamed protein product [Polarella glacialis]